MGRKTNLDDELPRLLKGNLRADSGVFDVNSILHINSDPVLQTSPHSHQLSIDQAQTRGRATITRWHMVATSSFTDFFEERPHRCQTRTCRKHLNSEKCPEQRERRTR